MTQTVSISPEERAEQIRMIRDSAASVVPADHNLKRIRALRFDGGGMDKAIWATMVEMGWPGLALNAEMGGIGLGMQEYAALSEELGKGLVPEPLIEGSLVAALVPDAIRSSLLAGETLVLPVGFAFENDCNVTFADNRLSGTSGHVAFARQADAFLVRSSRGLAFVDATAKGIAITPHYTHDGGHEAEVRFDNVEAQAVSASDDKIARIVNEAIVAKAAYLVGVMQRAFDITLEYLKVRKQFGREIGTFQVLQHRAVDMKIRLELARALVTQTARTLDDNKDALCTKAVSAAASIANQNAMMVCRESIQLHGGIGYTDEADIGLFLRKVVVLLNRYGSNDFHRQRYLRHYGEKTNG